MNIYEVMEKIKDKENSAIYQLGCVRIAKREGRLIIGNDSGPDMIFDDAKNPQFIIEGSHTFQEILDYEGKVKIYKEDFYNTDFAYLEEILGLISIDFWKAEDLKTIFTEKIWFKCQE